MKLFKNNKLSSQTGTRLGAIAGIAVGIMGLVSLVTAQQPPQLGGGGTILLPVGTVNLTGWAWSDMPDGSDQVINPGNSTGGRGFGWISMTAQNAGSGGGTYTTTLNTATGNLGGYAWSEYGGWLNLAPSGPYPIASPTGQQTKYRSAFIDPACITAGNANCRVDGWMRFVAGGTAQSGGWDGWVSMSGVNHSVTFNADPNSPNYGKFSGMAWGDWVAGWIDFSKVQAVVNPNPIAASVTISATPNTLTCPTSSSPRGQSATSTITWSGTNVDPGTCVATGGYGFTGTQSGTSGTVTVTGMNTASTPFSITCNKASGATGAATVTASTAITCSNLIVNPLDACPLQGAVGNQTGTGPWQIQGVWYGLNNGICIVDQCIDNTQYSLTIGFQTLLPLNYQNVGGVCRPTGVCTDSRADNPGILGTNQVVDNSLCTYTAFCSIPANQSLPQCQTGPTGPLKPIYNER